jgi:sec-independent protein translocase protein TatB
MFDIGFTELLLLGVVALLVIGPERLPHAARMTGAWIGKIRRTFASLQVEIEREVNASEVQEKLKQEVDNFGLTKIAQEFEETTSGVKKRGEQLLDSGNVETNTAQANANQEESKPGSPKVDS